MAIKRIIVAIFLSLLFIFLSFFLSKLINKTLKQKNIEKRIVRLIDRVIFYAILFIGLLIVLGYLKINITGLIAGAGIIGLTISWALSDIMRNIIAGLLLLIMRPFKIGDKIEIQGLVGIVRSINLRYTLIEKDNGEKILIPNVNTLTNPVIIKETKE
ncbi:MAG: mechanosensitive ion channel domain-containing protein [candidate division WOR-3 bacterium]|uniref:Mechanosensitive ion channel n=1 Tax=candidate division WOR-3 bacterium TaxID=2052148 RepID=A0A7V4CIA1_UNCW3